MYMSEPSTPTNYEVTRFPIRSKVLPANIKKESATVNIMAVFVFLPS